MQHWCALLSRLIARFYIFYELKKKRRRRTYPYRADLVAQFSEYCPWFWNIKIIYIFIIISNGLTVLQHCTECLKTVYKPDTNIGKDRFPESREIWTKQPLHVFRQIRSSYDNGNCVVGQQCPTAEQPQFKLTGFEVRVENACAAFQFRT